jgi:hypothetical protein
LPTYVLLQRCDTLNDATRQTLAHRLEAYSPKCLEGVFCEVRRLSYDEPPRRWPSMSRAWATSLGRPKESLKASTSSRRANGSASMISALSISMSMSHPSQPPKTSIAPPSSHHVEIVHLIYEIAHRKWAATEDSVVCCGQVERSQLSKEAQRRPFYHNTHLITTVLAP